MNSLEDALQIAVTAHAGQVDKGGQPYILHPLRVMQAMTGNNQRIVAILHDVVEDSSVTTDSLRTKGFSEEILAAITALTKRNGEDYLGFVVRAASNNLARPVKVADIRDNLDLTRISNPTDGDHERVIRYRRALKLAEAVGRDRGDDALTAPTILPLRERVCKEEVETECPGQGGIYACDFKVEGAESFEAVSEALKSGRVWNIDHHANLPANQTHITSTVIATRFLREHQTGPLSRVVINHTDCDSILSSALMMGLLEPTPEFEVASVHADHTGEPNRIADVLQALDETRRGARTDDQYLQSIRNLKLLLANRPLELEAAAALASREGDRKKASRIAEGLERRADDSVAYIPLEEEIDGALFLPFLPWAAVLMISVPHSKVSGHRLLKLRLGPAAPRELSLHHLAIHDFDDAYGGRWNAGSNKRGGGSAISDEVYLRTIISRLDRSPLR